MVHDSNQPIGITVWQRLEKNRIDDTENGCCRSDTQTKCQHSDNSKAGIPFHLPKRVSHVLDKTIERATAPGFANTFLRSRNAPEILSCAVIGILR